ncbi:MAG TPA: glycoside hydrolase family 127 protein [Spirochaetia bacterium]|nr:glycoside hydrolase family 127 protein [Spirochaetia bacterium]
MTTPKTCYRHDYPIAPAPFTAVTLRDRFWAPRLETNRTVTIPSVLRKCEESGRVDNFRRAGSSLPGPYVGKNPFDDTDVYKTLEGAARSLASHPDPELDAYVDRLIELIARAQEPDGYLYTNRTIDPRSTHPDAGPERWSNLVMSHELYNCGHLYESACAHHLATGKRSFLDVALRSADLVRREFGPNARHDIPGHQIIEMGLARLYRITGDRGYLETARFFLEQRGHHETRPLYQYEENEGYCQDHLPVLEQREAVGHAVRAVYMYSGMADVAALAPDPAYARALDAIWRSVVESRIYLTGGLGSRHKGEAFGEAFELPNATAYAETCAAIGSVQWNHRLFLLTGESRFYDVLEQTLYNRLLSGVSLKGDEFFYANPLESDGVFPFNQGAVGRQPWFVVSCCPTNLSRFFPSLPGYLYATTETAVYVNLFAGSSARVEVAGQRVEVVQETDYPWSGSVRITVHPERKARWQLLVRIPGWARGRVLGGSLYRFEGRAPEPARILLNGKPTELTERSGYASLDREWEDGDVVEIDLPMPVCKVIADSRIPDTRGKAAIQRGPIVYCVEGMDADRPIAEVAIGGRASLEAHFEPDVLRGLVVVQGKGFRAVPYYAWANRGPGTMRVWLRNSAG